MIQLTPANDIDFDRLADVMEEWRHAHVMATEARETGREVTHLVDQEQAAEMRAREIIGEMLVVSDEQALELAAMLILSVEGMVTDG